jgi:hypothetical protein
MYWGLEQDDMTDASDAMESRASSLEQPDAGESRPEELSSLEFERLQLLTRLLLGSLTQGSGELMERLRDLEREIEVDPELLEQDLGPGDETVYDLLRYLGIGLFARGQKRLARRTRRGYYFSLGAASWFLEQLDRATDNPLARPVRRPIESRVRSVWEQVGLIAQEGKREEQTAKVLTRRAAIVTLDELSDSLVENPELADLIRRQVTEKSAGLADVVIENTRRVTARADDVAEGLVRRLLRRRPRKELPPSPLMGKPQTMYSPEAQALEKDGNGN